MQAWARTLWALSDRATVMVTELECREAGSPPIETVIAVLEGPGRTTQYKIHKAADEVSQADVEALAAGGRSMPTKAARVSVSGSPIYVIAGFPGQREDNAAQAGAGT